MVVTAQTGKPIDFSIMPSFKCNLNCWFCMYDCSPENQIKLDFYKTALFISRFDWSQINMFGFYGGEPSIEMDLYDYFIAMVPEDIPKFVITNGAWSRDKQWSLDFIKWCIRHKFHIIVSSTPAHICYQDREFLISLSNECPDGLTLKEPDKIHAQGRAKKYKHNIIHDCEFSCQRTDRNIRLGLRPDGNIIFQNCHGEYHTIQTYNDPFDGIRERAIKVATKCYQTNRIR